MKIKKLQWHKSGSYKALGCKHDYSVEGNKLRIYPIDGQYNIRPLVCESEEDAKQKAQEHFEKEITQFLENQ